MKSFMADKKIFAATIGEPNIFNPMKPRKLPYKKFLESFKYAPRLAVNLLVEREVYETSRGANENGKFRKLPIKEFLLTKRKKPPFAGHWHLPGSFVLKGESLMDCVERVAREELGARVTRAELVEAFDDITGDPRGHVVDLVYRCVVKSDKASKGLTLAYAKVRPYQKFKVVGDTAEIKFFKKLPAKIGFNHKETLKKLGYV